MRKLFTMLAVLLWASSSFAATIFEAPYGVQNEFPFEIWSSDGLSVDVDESDDGNDAIVLCNAGTETESANTYTDEGSSYSIILSATEMQCETITVIIDEAVDTIFYVQTYGNASARNVSIPNAAPGSAGALLVAGNNDDFNVTNNVSLADGLTIARSSSNTSALTLTGNGTGHGLLATSGGGATGNGAQFTSAATNGSGIGLTATGTGTGINGTLATVTTVTNGVTVTTNNDKTGYSLLQAFPTNFSSMDINVTGGVGIDWANVQAPTTTLNLSGTTVGTAAALTINNDKTGYALSTAGVNAILLGQGIPAPTTIATLASQTSFTLNAGSADDNGYKGYGIIIRDASTSAQQALGCVRDYTGSSKTITLLEDPGIFTMAASDNVQLLPAYCDAQVQQDLLDTAILTCTVDTANFAGSSTTFACDLTDSAGVAVTSNIATDELKGKPFKVLSGAQKYEERYVFDTTWDGTNDELQVTIAASYPFSATLADGVIVVLE